MFRKVLVVAIALFSCPAFVSAQDIFFSFDEFSRVPTTTFDSDVTDTGSVYLFADENFDFNQVDVNFSTSNPNVAAFTGGQTFNSDGSFTQIDLLDPSNPAAGPTATDGRLFGVSFLTQGILPGNTGSADYRAGANGFLLAQLDYDLGGGGAANFDLSTGRLGVFNDGVGEVFPTFGSAELTALGEPAPPFVPPVDPPVEPPVVPPIVPPVDPPVVPRSDRNANFFFSFDENSRVPTSTVDSDVENTGSVFIFADSESSFNQLDIDFTNSDSSVVSITGGTTFNADGSFTVLNLLDPNDSTAGPTSTDGRLFGVSFETPGVDPANSETDPDFRAGADGFLLAQIDFDIIGGGDANFDFLLGDLGVAYADVNPSEFVDVGFESGTLTVLGDPVDPPVVPPVVPPVDPPDSSNPDIFLSFDENSRVTDLVLGLDTNSTSVFLFADDSFDVNSLDLDLSIGNDDVLSITGGITFNADGSFTNLVLLDPNDGNAGPTSTDARLFGISLLTPGIVPGNIDDPDHRPGVGGFLLARIDFDIVGSGEVDFDLILGQLGAVNDGVGQVAPTFGSARFSNEFPVAIPEPSSAILMILAIGGVVARRKRS